jgi:hypothetical protein
MTSERYLLTEVTPGGLLLDLESGSLLQLNESAALIWRNHLDGVSIDKIAEMLAARFPIDQAKAMADTQAALAVPSVEPSIPISNEFHYQQESDAYVFYHLERAVLAVDLAGARLSIREHADVTRLRGLILGLCPKLLSLRGHTVLHASAVSIGARVIAFSGLSGAGKTTTARMLERAGAKAICADKLVVRQENGRPFVVVEGERAVDAWVAEAVANLTKTGSGSCDGLDRTVAGPLMELAEIGFLNVNRRIGRSLTARLLTPREAAGEIFRNAFYGSDSSAAWKRGLDQACQLARYAVALELCVPDNLQSLESEAERIVARVSIRA